jgi:hypothetical protein
MWNERRLVLPILFRKHIGSGGQTLGVCRIYILSDYVNNHVKSQMKEQKLYCCTRSNLKARGPMPFLEFILTDL